MVHSRCIIFFYSLDLVKPSDSAHYSLIFPFEPQQEKRLRSHFSSCKVRRQASDLFTLWGLLQNVKLQNIINKINTILRHWILRYFSLKTCCLLWMDFLFTQFSVSKSTCWLHQSTYNTTACYAFCLNKSCGILAPRLPGVTAISQIHLLFHLCI